MHGAFRDCSVERLTCRKGSALDMAQGGWLVR